MSRPRPYLAIVATLLLSASVLAGCTDPKSRESDEALQTPKPTFDDKTGGIQGVLITADTLPIPEADVGLDLPSIPPVRTDAAGNFVFN